MGKRSIRRSDAQKQMLVWNGWSDMLDIGEDRLSGILGKREKCRPDRLAGYANCPLIPIDIIELHRHDVAGTQPKPSQQQDQCSVANTDGCRRGACRDALPDRFTINVAGQFVKIGRASWWERGCPLV